ncbi:MAG: hypothetical protein F6K35_38605 [Okeania sp. SIO2H7]|nr:hypothetical protein [Okeania sp. SIO2H7]
MITYRAISESEKLQQRLTFLKENSEEVVDIVAKTIGALTVAQKYEDATCAALGNTPNSGSFLEITPEYVQNLTRDLLISLLR